MKLGIHHTSCPLLHSIAGGSGQSRTKEALTEDLVRPVSPFSLPRRIKSITVVVDISEPSDHTTVVANHVDEPKLL